MSQKSPSVELESGLSIGYSEALATLPEDIKLGGGTHFLLARNGRGKSTLLKTIAGSLKALSGDYRVQGFMQYLPEDMRFDPFITPKAIFTSLLPKDKRSQALDLAKRIELDTAKAYGRLSTGNRRKTALILAEFSVREDQGNILLLDEPFSGLDAFARAEFEAIWEDSQESVLRLVSCHPDYDTMVMPSVLMIEGERLSYHSGKDQSWSNLKHKLN